MCLPKNYSLSSLFPVAVVIDGGGGRVRTLSEARFRAEEATNPVERRAAVSAHNRVWRSARSRLRHVRRRLALQR